jgi:hypothetical protein
MYAALVAYREEFGHCNVPRRWPANPKLSTWVRTRRRTRTANKLSEDRSEDRIRRLDELGFVWDPLDTAWEEMFSALVAYRDLFGHCNVPVVWPENPKLGRWVNNQRYARRINGLAKERFRRLDEIGFVWDLRDAQWEEMFATLVGYKEKYGYYNVPKGWPENPKLANWVTTQRRRRKANRLSKERIRRLDKIGFVWSRT